MKSAPQALSSVRVQRLCASVGACLLALLPHQHASAQAMTRSQALLSGFEVPSWRPMTWPETLELPASWEAGFRELTQQTRQTGREVAACLSVESALSSERYFQERLPALQRLRDLRDRRDSLSDAAWASESAGIRKALDAAGMRNEQPLFRLGQVQSGKRWSVHMVSSATTCPSSTVGQVHTHPNADSLPSDWDLGGALARPKLASWVEAVVGTDNTACVVIAGPTDANLERSRRAQLDFRIDSTFLSAGWALFMQGPRPGLTQLEDLYAHWDKANRPATVAILEREPRAAMYCGPLGQPLKRANGKHDVPPPHANPGLVLASKATTLMARELFGKAVPEIDFPFTPELDEKYLAYLRRAEMLTDEQARLAKAPNYAGLWDLQDAVLAGLMKKHQLPFSRMVSVVGILVPDGRQTTALAAFPKRVNYTLQLANGLHVARVTSCTALDPESETSRLSDCKVVAEYAPPLQR